MIYQITRWYRVEASYTDEGSFLCTTLNIHKKVSDSQTMVSMNFIQSNRDGENMNFINGLHALRTKTSWDRFM